MKHIYPIEPTPEIPRLALKPGEAAAALSMSKKSLWDRTFPRGAIPAVRVGTRICYFVHQLQAWADEEYARQQREAEQNEAGREGSA